MALVVTAFIVNVSNAEAEAAAATTLKPAASPSKPIAIVPPTRKPILAMASPTSLPSGGPKAMLMQIERDDDDVSLENASPMETEGPASTFWLKYYKNPYYRPYWYYPRPYYYYRW